MERSQEVLDLLNSLDKNTKRYTETYQELFNLHQSHYQEEEKTFKKMNDSMSSLSWSFASNFFEYKMKHGTFSGMLGSMNDSLSAIRAELVDKQDDQLTQIVGQIPDLLTQINLSIQKGMVVQAAMMSALSGQAAKIPNLKSLAKQDGEAIMVKLDTVFKEIKKNKGKKDTQDFVGQLSKKDVGNLAEGVIFFIDRIRKMKMSGIKLFNKKADLVSKGMSKIMTILDNIVKKRDRYEEILPILGTIVSVIKKMNVAFTISALLSPIIPFALIMFKAMGFVVASIAFYGLPIFRRRIKKGAHAIRSAFIPILIAGAAFGLLGKVYKKFDVPLIIEGLNKIFDLFNRIANMDIEYKVVMQNTAAYQAFFVGILSSFGNITTIFSLFKKFDKSEVNESMDKMELIFDRSLKLFDFFRNQVTSPRKIRKTIRAFTEFFGLIPDMVYSLDNLHNIIEERKLDEISRKIITKIAPVTDLLKHFGEINVHKPAKGLIKITWIMHWIIKRFEKLSLRKLEFLDKKISIISRFFDKLFDLFDKLDKNRIKIKQGVFTLNRLTSIGWQIFKLAILLSLTVPLIPTALLGLGFVTLSLFLLNKVTKHQKDTNLLKFAASLSVLSIALVLYSGSLFIAGIFFKSIDIVAVLVGIATITAFAAALTIVGTFAGTIAKGSLVLILIAATMYIISFAMMSFSNTAKSIDTGSYFAGIGLIAATGLAFGLMGISPLALFITLVSGIVILMSLSLAIASMGMKVFSNATQQIDPINYLIGLGLIAATAAVLGVIGIPAIAMWIAIGAGILLVIAVSVALFGSGLLSFAKAMKMLDPETTKHMLSTITQIGLAYAALGVLSTFIMMGAVAGVAIGLTLPFLAGALYTVSKLDEIDKDKMKSVLFMISFISLGYAIMGIGSLLILPGALSAVAIALTLPFLVGALYTLSKLEKIDLMQMLSVFALVALVSAGYVIMGLVSPLIGLGALSAIAISFTLPLLVGALYTLAQLPPVEWGQIMTIGGLIAVVAAGYALMGIFSPLILLGTVAMGGMATSLLTITTALQESMKFNWKSVPIDDIQKVLVGLAESFAIVGADGQTGLRGFLNTALNIFGLGPENVGKGIKAIKGAGEALIDIAKGLVDFSKIAESLNLINDDDNNIITKIGLLLNAITVNFAAMGQETGGGSLLKGIVGWDFGQTDVERGISAVKGVGDVFKDIADGILEWESLDMSNLDTITTNISKVLNSIRLSFAAIGKDDNTGSSLMKSYLGFDFGEGDVTNGIDAVKGVGETFIGIAEGLQVWSDLKKAGVDVDDVTKNINSVLTLISEQFAVIGKQDESGWFSDGDVTNGMEAVAGVGEVFKGIAEGLKVYADLEKMGFKKGAFNPDVEGSIAHNMLSTLKATSDVFAVIGKSVKMETVKDLNGTPIQSEMTSDTAKGIKAVSGVGSILKGIADSVKVFSEVESEKIPKIKDAITSIISVVAGSFAEIGRYGFFSVNPDDIKKGVEAIKGVGTELEMISKSIQPYADLQKGKQKINIEQIKNNIRDIITVNLKILGSIGVLQGEGNKDKALKFLGLNKDDLELIKMDNVSAGSTALAGVKDGIEQFTKLTDIANKMGSGDIDFKKIVLHSKNLLRIVLGTFGRIGRAQSNQERPETSEYFSLPTSQLFNNWWIRRAVNPLTTAIKNLDLVKELADTLSGDEFLIDRWEERKKILQEVIGEPLRLMGSIGYDKTKVEEFSTDLNNYFKAVMNFPFKDEKIEAMDTLVSFFERFAKIESPFEKFTKTFSTHLKDFKDYIYSINTLSIDRVDALRKFQYQTTELVSIEPNKFTTNTENIKEIIREMAELQQSQQMDLLEAQRSTANIFSNFFGSSEGNKDTKQEIVVNFPEEILNHMNINLMRINENVNGMANGSKKISVRNNKL